MAELLSSKLRKDIENSGFTGDLLAGLYDAIEGMSDKDLREYLWTNRQYYQNNLPEEMKEIPDLNEYTSIKPNFGNGEINLEKAFGDKDILNHIDEYNMNQIDYVARKNGMTGKQLLSQMYKQKQKDDQYKIAHGEDLGGWFDSPQSFVNNLYGAGLSLTAPRTQAAIEEGKSPEAKDVVGDVVETGLYAMPWGNALRATKAGAKLAEKAVGNKIKSGALNVAENTLTPALVETYDANVYVDDDENGRGTWDPAEVAAGTFTNIYTPRVLKRGANILKNSEEKPAKQLIQKFGDINADSKELAKQYSKQDLQKAIADTKFEEVSNINRSNEMADAKKAGTFYPIDKEQLQMERDLRHASKNRAENVFNKIKNNELTEHDPDYNWLIGKGALGVVPDQGLLDFYRSAQRIRGALDYAKDKSLKTILAEEAMQSYGTNKVGDYLYENDKIRIPVVGPEVTRYLKDRKNEKEQDELEKAAERKWKIHF